jgi:hypothetical protein
MAGLQTQINGQPGIQIRHRLHEGLTHEKLSVLVGSGLTVFGSSNWTSASSDYQLEHNLFTNDPVFYAWSRVHFDRKWNNTGGAPETQPFVPLPPHDAVPTFPANGAVGQPLQATLQWYAGPWAHKYDVFVGTAPDNMVKIVDDVELGPYDVQTVTPALVPGTHYFWRVVSRTMANLTATGPTWSFTTAGVATPNTGPTITLTQPVAGGNYTGPASVTFAATASDSDGTVTRVDFLANGSVVATVTAAPFTATWSAVPAGTYSITARAWDNRSAMTTSAAVTITVVNPTTPPVTNPNPPPTITPQGSRKPVAVRTRTPRATSTGGRAVGRR